MTENNGLSQKRNVLKEQINQRKYKTLADVLFDRTGSLIQKLTRSSNPASMWTSAVGLALVTWSIGGLISLLLGELEIFAQLMLVGIWLELLALSAVIAIKIIFDRTLTGLSLRIVDAIVSEADLDDLKSRLTAVSQVKKHLFITLSVGLLFGLMLPTFWLLITEGSLASYFASPVFGVVIMSILIALQGVISWIYVFPVFGLPATIGQYDLDLYTVDPASSEVIDALSELLNQIVFVFSVNLVIFTIGLLVLIPLLLTASLVLLALVWGLLIVIFLGGQSNLSKTITRAKWKTLNDIQAKIEQLQAREDIPTKETLEHISALMDYHDRIRTTRNSALDIRAGLSFLQSLLLPVIGLLVATIKNVIGLVFS